MRLPTILTVITALFAAACALDEPQPWNPPAGDGSAADHWAPYPDFSSSCANRPTPPTLTAPASTTSQAVQPFRGSVPGAAQIRVTGGASGMVGPVGPTGTFCIEVPLNLGSNALVFTAIDATGCESLPSQITVNRVSASPDAGPAPGDAGTGATNVALGATVTSEDPVQSGQPANLVDGDPATLVSFAYEKPNSFQPPFYCTGSGTTWAAVDLGQAYAPSRLVITWKDTRPSTVIGECASGCSYGRSYKVLTSDVGAPGDPSPGAAGWTTAYTTTSGNGGADPIVLTGKPVRHVALWLESNEQVDGVPTDCWEDFILAELEVLASGGAGGPGGDAGAAEADGGAVDRCP